VPSVRRTVSQYIIPSILAALALPVAAQSLAVISGNGQIVSEQFVTVAPMTLQARDAQNRPLAGVRINWSVTSGQGTLINPISATDSNGLASTYFLGTNVPGGSSIQQSTVTGQSSFGGASFFVTTAIVRLQNGGTGAPPLVELLKPTPEARSVTGDAGSTLNSAITVRVGVQSGPDTGRPVPNVGVRVYNYEDPETSPSASCRSPNGIVLTDSTGTATCDLVLNNRTGTTQIALIAGEAQITPSFALTIRPGVPCTYTLQPTSQSFPSQGGSGTFTLAAPASCSWTVQSNANWILPTGAATGSGSASISFTVLSNPNGTPRESTLTVGGQSFTVSQAAAGSSGVLTITSPGVLPSITTGQPYSFTFQAQGGRQPYQWSVGAGLPQGLNLSSSGVLSGLPVLSGVYSFPVGVLDAGGGTFTRSFQLTVTNPDQSLNPVITNSSFPNGAVGQAYQQFITSANGCPSLVSTSRYAVVAGALPLGLALQQFGERWAITGSPTQSGAFAFTIAVTDPCGRTSSSGFTITIVSQGSANSPLTSAPQTLTFNVFAGSTVSPTDQSLTILSSGQTLNYTSSASTDDGRPWIALRAGASGLTPGTITVGVSGYESLLAGSYRGTISVGASGASPLVIPVVLNVSAAPTLSAFPVVLTFNASVTFAPITQGTIRQSLSVTGPSGTAFTASGQTSNGAAWLRVSPASGNAPANLDVDINHVGLGPGVYTGQVLIGSPGATPTRIPVTLIVNNPPQFVWSTTGMTFAATSGDSSLLPQTLTLSSSTSPVRVNVTANTLSGGNWLKVDPASGTTPVSVTVSVDTTGLRSGQYNGEIIARAADGSNLAASAVRVILLITDTTPTITTVVNAASELQGPLTPGGWAVVRGTFLGSTGTPTPYRTVNGRVDTTLSDVRILVDGLPAPVISASSQRTVFQVPYSSVDRQRLSIVAEYKGNRSQPFEVPLVFVNPAIFVVEGTQGDIFNEDGTRNNGASPAGVGEVVTILATGEGPTDPAVLDGIIIGTENVPKPAVSPVQVWMDGQEAEVVSFGAVPGMPAGLFQVKARIPASVTRGISVAVTLGVNSNYSPDPVTVAIKP
jgi:uncharacterized protein (TIGR03437 family)